MKVNEIKNSEVRTCHPNTNLAAASQLMWGSDCGALPVLDDQGQVVGMITDRDICMAVGSRNRPASEITVFDVKPNPTELYTCASEDNIQDAMKTMRKQGVRRLPVVKNGKLNGILCLHDIALNAKKHNSLSSDDVAETLRAICEHQIARQIMAA
jgi:CBS domain-containing protein